MVGAYLPLVSEYSSWLNGIWRALRAFSAAARLPIAFVMRQRMFAGVATVAAFRDAIYRCWRQAYRARDGARHRRQHGMACRHRGGSRAKGGSNRNGEKARKAPRASDISAGRVKMVSRTAARTAHHPHLFALLEKKKKKKKKKSSFAQTCRNASACIIGSGKKEKPLA